MRDGAFIEDSEVLLDHSGDREGRPPEAQVLIARLAELGL
jgi:hypothetical protein